MDDKKQFSDFYMLMTSITTRPAMYGVNDVDGIHLFIFGYVTASKSPVIHDFYSQFRVFVNNEFAGDFSKKADYDWPRLIRFNSGDCRHSIELFAVLFERFCELFVTGLKV